MVKRLVAAPLWFFTMWWGYAILAYFTGLPEEGGAIVGALVAAFVFMDPTGAIWGTKTRASSANRLVDAARPPRCASQDPDAPGGSIVPLALPRMM